MIKGENTDMTLFERIKLLAQGRGKNLKEVAITLGFGENYIYSLNSGKKPSSDKLEALADYFDVSVDYLLGRTDRKKIEVETLAAHHDGDEWTEEELADIEAFKQFVRMRKEQRMKE